MRPVTKITTGLVLVFGAFRLEGFDLLLDPVGWGLCAAGLLGLRYRDDDSFGRAAYCAAAMLCLSIVATVTSTADPGHLRTVSLIVQVIGLAAAAGSLVTVWLVTDAVIGRVHAGGDTSRAALLDVLRWAVTGLGALGTAAGYGYADLGAVISVACFAAGVVLIAVLYRSARLPYLSAEWEPVADWCFS
ncbi:hypothetical protein ACFOWE_22015 [Planomonospora corallina]|uniref:Integral membrane protein n=1 Tax=Planomonospora corallina TaxID=1806052 RepID=A0ABV8ID78_9ACTN